ncbi:adenosylcobinamide-GDP ribazoletransferase [Halalkalibacter nanhaiisediminis]|uniref:Adenosylcobinamide-GDP ribazoletransferase n=1 Tax=Halalkalibacter nanhaiisediminis TaxID=688079 RepID=A0A562QCY8_9BACI|nr:adenosylcobinamide-GDP ribazoletransferase [Halalkalibacter nanhaiisediminis]TWI54627.1 cobalamin-5'-phosphate synthase [Halalkalibacter nanhaiisediminis]
MSNVKIWIDGILLAFQLLTTIPITKQVEWDESRARASVAAYPIIGLLLGGLLALQAYVLLEWSPFSTLVITVWLLTFSILYSGGLHLDGWADFHDAVFSRRDRKRKLEIMKDPRIGTFGVLALLLLLGWRLLFIYESLQLAGHQILFALVLIPFLVRLLLGWQLLLGSFARQDGMAAALKAVKKRSMKLVFIGWSLLAMLVTLLFSPLLFSLVVTSGIFLFLWMRWIHYQIGGITGDTTGAGGEGGETILWGILWLLLLFGMD